MRWFVNVNSVIAAVGLVVAAISSASADDASVLRIDFVAPPIVDAQFDELTEEETFSGRYEGIVVGDDGDLFADTAVTCEFNGYASEGRAFSCGFTMVEKVAGRCLFTADNGDSAVAEWTCGTGAFMTSDARCEGKMAWVDGTGRFAGIVGEAKMHSDLFLQPGEGFVWVKGQWTVPSLALLSD